MQAQPYDVTPGFVIKQTFLELASEHEEEVPVVRRRVSDSFIHFRLSTATALYGAAAKRLHADSSDSFSDSTEELTDVEPNPMSSSFGKRDSFGSSTTAPEWQSRTSSFTTTDESTSSQVTADFHADPICRRISSDDSDSADNAAEEPVLCISIGSQSHPDGCGRACKYNMKRRGCKDGEACTFCHLCKWKPPKDKTRNQRRRAAIVAAKAKARAAAEAEAIAEDAEAADEAEAADATDNED